MTKTQRCALLASIIGSGIVFLDMTVVNVALPAIRAGLNGTLATQQWIVEAYALTLSSLLLVGGSLGDMLGRRRVFMGGTLAFGICSLLCAVSPSSTLLIAARGIQGVAGAMLVPSTLALLIDTFDEEQRPAAIASWTKWSTVAVVGPLLGGAIIQVASWRWIFAINVVPVGVTLFLLTRLPPDRPTAGRVDWLGAGLCALGLGGPVFALIEQPGYGWRSPVVFAPLVLGVALLIAFVAHERLTAHPMMPLGLFTRRNFAFGNLTTLALYAGLGVATFLIVLFEQQVAGYTPLAAGLSLMPLTALLFSLSRRFGALAVKLGPHRFMAGGPALAGAGLLLLTRIGAHADYASQVLPGVLVFGLGMALTVAPLTATVLGAVDPGRSGVASGINNAVARVASLLAVAAVGALVATSFNSRLHSDLPTGRLPTPARALVINRDATPRQRAALVDASVHGLHVGLIAAGCLAILGGLLSLIGIEDPRPEGPDRLPAAT